MVNGNGKIKYFKSSYIRKILLMSILLISLLLLLSYFFQRNNIQKFDTTGRPILRILFVGNSYTFFNDMPRTIEELAEHDPSSNFRVETEMLVEGGATLAGLLTTPKAQIIINKKKWDYVVLQPQSLWATTNSRVYSTKKALISWNLAIRKIGAQPVFFMTWQRQPNVGWYRNPDYPNLKNPEYMDSRIKEYSKYLAKEHKMILSPIGQYWSYGLKHYPSLKLYSMDGTHPSKQGSLLIALVFYKMLVDPTLENITYWPLFLNYQDRHKIFELATKSFSPSLY